MTSLRANLAASGAPGATDDITQGYSVGSFWLTGSAFYVCTSNAAGSATWISVAGGGGGITSLRVAADTADVSNVIVNSAIGATNAIVVTVESNDQYGVGITARDGVGHSITVKLSSLPPAGTYINIHIAT